MIYVDRVSVNVKKLDLVSQLDAEKLVDLEEPTKLIGDRVYRMIYLVSTSSAVAQALQQIAQHTTDLHYDVLDNHAYPSLEAAAVALPSLQFRARP